VPSPATRELLHRPHGVGPFELLRGCCDHLQRGADTDVGVDDGPGGGGRRPGSHGAARPTRRLARPAPARAERACRM